MQNQAVAHLLDSISRLLTIKGEDPFRLRAYNQAARNIAQLGADIEDYWRADRLEDIEGVGPSIAAKIDEFLRTGRCQYYEELRADIAPEAAELLDVPSIGPVRAREIHRLLGVSSLAELEAAARAGQLRAVHGIGERSEARILKEIERLRTRTRRLLLGQVLPAAETVTRDLARHPAVAEIEFAGSLRRQRETIGDIDLIAASDQPALVTSAFASLPLVREVLSRGPTRASVLIDEGLQVDLRVVRPDEYGAALTYFTGSKEHNIALRDLALARGQHLSEYGLFDERSGRRLASETETDIYAALGLEWIPPELRENRGEIAAARNGTLPHLIQASDLRGDLHVHTNWSDGRSSLEEMVQAAIRRGYEYVAITDHSASLGVAHGLSTERLALQRRAIDDLNRRYRPFRVLHGVELEVRSDGSLDYSDEWLARFDLVGASAHSGLGQPGETFTGRVLRALRNPYVTIINHPTGRLLNGRPGASIDLERVIAAAAAEGVALEINGSPDRLDLDDVWSRRAAAAGVLLACGSDAHSVDGLANARLAISVARRGWLAPDNVLNTRPLAELLRFRDRRRKGRAA